MLPPVLICLPGSWGTSKKDVAHHKLGRSYVPFITLRSNHRDGCLSFGMTSERPLPDNRIHATIMRDRPM
jgi:hypothetical protein